MCSVNMKIRVSWQLKVENLWEPGSTHSVRGHLGRCKEKNHAGSAKACKGRSVPRTETDTPIAFGEPIKQTSFGFWMATVDLGGSELV
jgi:hypothetical protein